MALLLHKPTGRLEELSDYQIVDVENYKSLTSMYKDKLEKGYGNIVYNEESGILEYRDGYAYMILLKNGSVYVSNTEVPGEENKKITMEAKARYEEDIQLGYIYYIKDGVVKKEMSRIGEIFDWETKTFKPERQGISTEEAKFGLYSKDLVTEINNIGIRIDNLLNKVVYLPVNAENIAYVQLLRLVNEDKRKLIVYEMINGVLDTANPITIAITSANLSVLYEKIITHKTNVENACETYLNRLDEIKESSEILRIIDTKQYITDIINIIEEAK